MWIRRAVKFNNDLMKTIPKELVTKQPFNRLFTSYELVKYPLTSDIGQIRLVNRFLWFVLTYLVSRRVGVATKDNDCQKVKTITGKSA